MSIKILIIAEHDGDKLLSETMKTVDAAVKIGTCIDLVVFSDNNNLHEEAARLDGITNIITLSESNCTVWRPENISIVAKKLTLMSGYTHVLASSSSFGKSIMPRLSALLNVGQVSDVIKVISSDCFVHPIYAGNALRKVVCRDEIKVLTIRSSAFNEAQKNNEAEIITLDLQLDHDIRMAKVIGNNIAKDDRPRLTDAKIIVSGGKGLSAADKFSKIIYPLADKINAAVGASRAAVDSEFISNDHQVGQTGKIVSPELYIAIGISGAVQHVAGIKDSGVIVAINHDPDSNIFSIADYGFVGDLFDVVPEMTEKL